MKTVAFLFGLFIGDVGAAGILAPSVLVWIARLFASPAPFFLLAAIRLAFGLILIGASSTSRAPKALRVLGYIVIVLGIGAALAGGSAVAPAREAIDWWLRVGSGVARLTGILILALGSFVVYACAPTRRAA
jgi:hypothetical protein